VRANLSVGRLPARQPAHFAHRTGLFSRLSCARNPQDPTHRPCQRVSTSGAVRTQWARGARRAVARRTSNDLSGKALATHTPVGSHFGQILATVAIQTASVSGELDRRAGPRRRILVRWRMDFLSKSSLRRFTLTAPATVHNRGGLFAATLKPPRRARSRRVPSRPGKFSPDRREFAGLEAGRLPAALLGLAPPPPNPLRE